MRTDIHIPFDLQGGLVLVRASAAGAEGAFIVDTGCGLTSLDTGWASARGVQANDSPGIKAHGTGAVAATFASTSLRVGELALEQQQVLLLDLSAVSQKFGVAIDGIIGFDFFSRGIVDIDFRRRTLSLVDAFDGGGAVIPVDLTYRIPIAGATVVPAAGVELPARLAIDLGSTRLDVRLLGAFVDAHQQELDQLEMVAGSFGTGVGGAIDGHLTRFHEVRLGTFSVPSPSAGITRSRDGALGLGIFDGTVGCTAFHDARLILDYARKQVIVQQ